MMHNIVGSSIRTITVRLLWFSAAVSFFSSAKHLLSFQLYLHCLCCFAVLTSPHPVLSNNPIYKGIIILLNVYIVTYFYAKIHIKKRHR